MTYKRLMIVVVGTGIILAGSARADQKKDLWGQGRVEVVFGGGSPGDGCGDCDIRRPSRSDRYPIYRDGDSEYGDRGYGRGNDRWKDRAEAAREREKDRREAFREREKDRREWEREQAKAEREAWKEEQKARREWEKERDKAEREARKEWYKADSWNR